MADVKISALPAATSSTGPDLLVINQSGTTKQITNLAFHTNATLVTPTLGVATATSVNKVLITAPATTATLTIAEGKTLTASNSLILAGGDGKTVTFGQTVSFAGIDGKTVTLNGSPSFSADLTFAGTNGKTLTVSNSLTLAGTDAKVLTLSNSLTLAGTDSTVMTFPTTSATVARTDAAQSFTGTQTFTGAIAVTGTTTLSAALVGSVQTLSGAGAIDLVTLTTRFTSTAAGNALTLANGTEGQLKTIIYYAEAAGADTGVLTPANLGAATTVTFNAVGDTALLQFTGTDWWVIAVRGAVVA